MILEIRKYHEAWQKQNKKPISHTDIHLSMLNIQRSWDCKNHRLLNLIIIKKRNVLLLNDRLYAHLH